MRMGENGVRQRVLIVDDVAANRLAARRCLAALAVEFEESPDGQDAIERLRSSDFDLVLLDLEMPRLDGHGVLAAMKSEPRLSKLPVLIVSSNEEVERVVRCLEGGADDYLSKPFNPVVFRARVSACLERKRLRDDEIRIMNDLHAERERSERLLLNVLPASIAARLKAGPAQIAEQFEEATVFFAELADAPELSRQLKPDRAVGLLDELFSAFDALAERHGVEKIKTVGDVYIGVGGVPERRADHAPAVAEMALGMQREGGRILSTLTHPMSLKIGVCSGPVLAGVIGRSRFSYDLWGDTVKVAAFMASSGIPGYIQVAEETRVLLDARYLFEERGAFYVEGRGEVRTYLLTGSA